MILRGLNKVHANIQRDEVCGYTLTIGLNWDEIKEEVPKEIVEILPPFIVCAFRSEIEAYCAACWVIFHFDRICNLIKAKKYPDESEITHYKSLVTCPEFDLTRETLQYVLNKLEGEQQMKNIHPEELN